MDRETINMTVYACGDIECIRAGHPDHFGTVTEYPDGTVAISEYGTDLD